MIPFGGSGGVLLGGGSIPMPSDTTPPEGAIPSQYPDTIKVFPATYDTDADAYPTQTDTDPGVTMAARVDWMLIREPLTVYAVPEGVRRATIFTATDPGVERPRQRIQWIASALGTFATPREFRSVDAVAEPAGGKSDTEYATLVERRV